MKTKEDNHEKSIAYPVDSLFYLYNTFRLWIEDW